MHSETSTLRVYIWQTKKWGKMLSKSNQVEAIFNIDNIQIEKRSLGMKQFGFFILGISLSEISDINTLNKIKILAEKEKVLFTQIETINYTGKEENIYKELFKENIGYYKKFITRYTAVIDLEKTEEVILADMKPKGRYNIKLALKKEIEVKEVENNKENIKKYYDLMIETTSRDNFSGNSLDYYITFLKELENSKLLLAYKDGKVISGGIFVFDKELSIYYYGASTSQKEYRNMMAPYLVQWEAIKIAKKMNSKIFDFLGVATPNSINDPLEGVTSFKRKLTPDIREVSEGYIFINRIFIYRIFKIIKKIKSIIK
ncbi:MAG: peptidoglycan bridge formation glycyltransferase FemA/FemB family protein [Candidatus Gracilibacteria bacterium]|nr:peptidoglycan bridge formation glycyltransferase FemA/FemB family protein [Candidatus Gracilibacteria bacterium]MDQ7022511.1 peptidoglycan bridge formation glycyltransferase FemA/FemB family protein [Candidatus Gracilibacteria bacterium]